MDLEVLYGKGGRGLGGGGVMGGKVRLVVTVAEEEEE